MAPPPTRGWTLVALDLKDLERGSPAPAKGWQGLRSLRAPPPTRGWTRCRARPVVAALGSPAHAGMDPPSSTAPPSRSRLPRPRGDGPDAIGHLPQALVAPPPTRGWTVT